jgi:hypothetical protein
MLRDRNERMMSDTLEYIQKRARELARSGKHAGWRSVAFELQFEPDLKHLFWFYVSGDALHWLHNSATKAELDELCLRARHSSPGNRLTVTQNLQRGRRATTDRPF